MGTQRKRGELQVGSGAAAFGLDSFLASYGAIKHFLNICVVQTNTTSPSKTYA